MSTKKSNTASNTLNIYQRINAVMGEVSFVKKTGKGTGGNGLPYKSVSHDDVTGLLNVPMQKHGIVLKSDVVECTQDGNRTIVKLEVSFINIDDPKDFFSVQYYGYGIDKQDKGIGKAISYALKYCLLKTFMLQSGTNDDVESHNIDYRPDPSSDAVITTDQEQVLDLMINGRQDLRETILHRCNGNLRNITQKQYPLIVQWVKRELGQ